MEAFNWLRGWQDRQAKTDEAEHRWYRKQMGEPVGTNEVDEMGHVILGDVNHPAPVVIPQQPQNNWLAHLLAAALAAGGGYLYATKNKTPVTQPSQASVEFDDETISVGLGRIEDYQNENEN